MLMAPAAVLAAVGVVGPEDYYSPGHGHVHAAVLAVWARNEPVDITTVGDQLRREGLIDAIGGASRLTSFQGSTPATSAAPTYARIVADMARLRRLIGAAGEIAEIGYSVPQDVPEAVERAEQTVYAVADKGRQHGPRSLGEAMPEHLELVQARQEGRVPTGLSLGWPNLDDILGGLPAGGLLTIAARPNVGKTTFALGVAANIAMSRPVLFVSLEMGEVELLDKLLAQWGGVNSMEVRRGLGLSAGDLDNISLAGASLSDLPIEIAADPEASLLSVRAAARRVAARYRQPPVVIIDYLQLLVPPSRGGRENRQVEVADLARGCKRLAGDMGTVVITLAQLNRALESRLEKRPMLSDLRESGAVEQDSTAVAFLFREELYRSDRDTRGKAEVIVAKNRHGRTGTAHFTFTATTGVFTPAITPYHPDRTDI